MEPQTVIIGVDEAGRGAFLGRIYSAAAVHTPTLLEDAAQHKIVLRDSKKMTPRQRGLSCDYLTQNIPYGVGWCDEKEIDQLGITRCNILSMHRAIEDLLARHPHLVVEKIHVDGVLFAPFRNIPHETIVRGDATHPEIATASILAKTLRDRHVAGLCDKHPELEEHYGVRSNKGYGTAKHIDGIRRYGLHPFHRKLFVRNHYRELRFLH